MTITDTITADGWLATVIEAGALPMPGPSLAPAGTLADMLALPSNVLLLRGHGRVMVVDTAAGPLTREWPGATGDLAGALAAHGCSLDEVDTVILTHLDFDHCGGVATGTWPDALTPAFPRARVAVSADAAEWARTLEPPHDSACRCLEVVAEAGLLDEVPYGQELAPGVTLVRAPGHRPGHAAVTVGEAVHLADVIHHPSHVAHPEWDHEFDSDPEMALRTRTAMLAGLAGAPTCASHIAGWGRIEPDGDGFRWAPL
jgi:glyoxylase-like metal-dependent hydrolase (beta-lactamase superfamily II)